MTEEDGMLDTTPETLHVTGRAGDFAEDRIAHRLHGRHGIDRRYLDLSRRFFANDHVAGEHGSDLGFGQ